LVVCSLLIREAEVLWQIVDPSPEVLAVSWIQPVPPKRCRFYVLYSDLVSFPEDATRHIRLRCDILDDTGFEEEFEEALDEMFGDER
jgi:hypothetical protein